MDPKKIEKEELLQKIAAQLSCICKQHRIDFMFVGTIPHPNGKDRFDHILLDGDCNLAEFIGEAGVKIKSELPDFFQKAMESYRNHDTEFK